MEIKLWGKGEDEEFYEKVLFHGMCYVYTYRLGIMLNRSSDPRISSDLYGIMATMPDRLVDVLMKMGFKGLIRNSGWDLE